MGTKLTISRDDVVASTLLTPGWYPCEAFEYSEKAAKSDASLNRNLKFRVFDGEFAGVQLRTTFNEKFSPLLKPLIESVGGSFKEGETVDLEDVSKLKMRMLIHVKRGEYNGAPTNEIDGFRRIE